jgi:hypothetical protein
MFDERRNLRKCLGILRITIAQTNICEINIFIPKIKRRGESNKKPASATGVAKIKNPRRVVQPFRL